MIMDATIEELQDQSLMSKVIRWRETHVNERQFTLVLSFFVGFFAAVAAFILHWIITQIQLLLTA